MKHIEKRFLPEYGPDQTVDLSSSTHVVDMKDPTRLSIIKSNVGQQVIIETEKNYKIGGYIQNLEGHYCIIPVPDLTLVYFDSAQQQLKKIKDSIYALKAGYNLESIINETSILLIYSFYRDVSSFVIFSFTALESFIHRLIPEDISFPHKTNKCLEIYNKKQLAGMQFKILKNDVVTFATGLKFHERHPKESAYIDNLQNFRNKIIHTKSEGTNAYKHILEGALNLDYLKTLHAVRLYMNFHIPDYIVDCGCGGDF